MATLERSAGSKLGWMIAGRLVTALLLSVVGTLWTGQASQSINKSLGLLTIVACLTILYTLIFRLSKNILLQARFQLTVDVLLVLKQGMGLTSVGLMVGLAAAFGLTRLLSGLLFGVAAVDVTTFASISLLLVIVSLLACYLPARRAMRIDPLSALRYE